MAEAKKKIRIGDLLVQNDVITEQQLMTALREQKNTGRKLGRTLIDLGYVEEDNLLNILSRQLDVPFSCATSSSTTSWSRSCRKPWPAVSAASYWRNRAANCW